MDSEVMSRVKINSGNRGQVYKISGKVDSPGKRNAWPGVSLVESYISKHYLK